MTDLVMGINSIDDAKFARKILKDTELMYYMRVMNNRSKLKLIIPVPIIHIFNFNNWF